MLRTIFLYWAIILVFSCNSSSEKEDENLFIMSNKWKLYYNELEGKWSGQYYGIDIDLDTSTSRKTKENEIVLAEVSNKYFLIDTTAIKKVRIGSIYMLFRDSTLTVRSNVEKDFNYEISWSEWNKEYCYLSLVTQSNKENNGYSIRPIYAEASSTNIVEKYESYFIQSRFQDSLFKKDALKFMINRKSKKHYELNLLNSRIYVDLHRLE